MRYAKSLFAAVTMLPFQMAGALPPETYAKAPLYDRVALSPDGNNVAMVTTKGEQREAIVQSLDDRKNATRLQVGYRKINRLEWIGPNYLLISASASDDAWSPRAGTPLCWVYDLKNKKALVPWDFREKKADKSADSSSRQDSTKEFYFMAGSAYEGAGLFRFDPDGKTLELMDPINPKDKELKRGYFWPTAKTGDAIARVVYDFSTREWMLSIPNGKTIFSHKYDFELPEVPGLDPMDGESLVVTMVENSERLARSISMQDGKWGAMLPEKWQGDRYLRDPYTGKLFASIKYAARLRHTFFDERLMEMWNRIVQAFPGEEVSLESYSKDFRKIIVEVFGKKSGSGYVLFDNDSGQFSYLGSKYAGIEAKDVFAMQPVSYQSQDGMTINAYLTIPKTDTTKNLPLIVVTNDTPDQRIVSGYKWFPQALASMGYLVLTPNPRGSGGYDQRFEEAGEGELGQKMQTDISDGVRALAKLGIVDPKRVCIVGNDYGGYAALMGAVSEPDVYRCAVSASGISDLREYFKGKARNSPSPADLGVRRELKYLGATDINDPLLVQRSPAALAGSSKNPVMLIHGYDDKVVPPAQSRIMVNELKKAGKPVELVEFKSDDHWFVQQSTREALLKIVVPFLQKNNPP